MGYVQKAKAYPMRSIFSVKKTRAALKKVESLQADVDYVVASEKAGVRELSVETLKDNLFSNSKESLFAAVLPIDFFTWGSGPITLANYNII